MRKHLAVVCIILFALTGLTETTGSPAFDRNSSASSQIVIRAKAKEQELGGGYVVPVAVLLAMVAIVVALNLSSAAAEPQKHFLGYLIQGNRRRADNLFIPLRFNIQSSPTKMQPPLTVPDEAMASGYLRSIHGDRLVILTVANAMRGAHLTITLNNVPVASGSRITLYGVVTNSSYLQKDSAWRSLEVRILRHCGDKKVGVERLAESFGASHAHYHAS